MSGLQAWRSTVRLPRMHANHLLASSPPSPPQMDNKKDAKLVFETSESVTIVRSPLVPPPPPPPRLC